MSTGMRIQVTHKTTTANHASARARRGTLAHSATRLDKHASKAHAQAGVVTRPVADQTPDHMVRMLIDDAIGSNATDVHFDPNITGWLLRYRIDGELHPINRLPRTATTLLARLKKLAHLTSGPVENHVVPETGRFTVAKGEVRYGIRVTVVPTVQGEKLTLHISEEATQPPGLIELGYWGAGLQALGGAIAVPHGLVLICGPLDSGTSTTLYSIMGSLNRPQVSIASIEDPVDYSLPYVNQIQANPRAGLTVSSGLRMLLRQDPNIVCIGELSDAQTAALALQAALGGRLVLAGMHARSAVNGLWRLQAMGVEPYLLANTVRAVASQRLARRLCQICRIGDSPSIASLAEFKIRSKSELVKLWKLWQAHNESRGVNDQPSRSIQLWRARPGGCSACHKTGYKGRIALCEVLPMDEQTQKLLTGLADGAALEQQAVRHGMTPLLIDGLIKVMAGLTSVEEVLRVTR